MTLFAATPPLEALKILLSLAVTLGCNPHKKLLFIDIKKAFFHALARRTVYVALPPEDSEPGMCGLLRKSMYGTRDAAQNW